MWVETGELGFGVAALGHDLVGCPAVEHALAAGAAGGVEAAQEWFELAVRADVDAEHLGADTAICRAQTGRDSACAAVAVPSTPRP